MINTIRLVALVAQTAILIAWAIDTYAKPRTYTYEDVVAYAIANGYIDVAPVAPVANIELTGETTFCFACDDHAVEIHCNECDETSECSVCGCRVCGATEQSKRRYAVCREQSPDTDETD